MSNRGSHFTSEMGGSLAQALSHPAMGQTIGGLAVLGALTSPIWLTAYFLIQSALLFLGGPEAAAARSRHGEPTDLLVVLLAPWVGLALFASLVHGVKAYRRRKLPPVARRFETRRARRLAYVAWGLVAVVATLGGLSGVYAEVSFRYAHPDLNSRLFLACPHLFPKGEANMTRIPGDPIPGLSRMAVPEFEECWPYIAKADQVRRCATPGRGLPSEREALPRLCQRLAQGKP